MWAVIVFRPILSARAPHIDLRIMHLVFYSGNRVKSSRHPQEIGGSRYES